MAAPEIAEPQKLPMLRKIIGQHMMSSLQSTAQLSYFADADVTALLDKRQAWKAGGQNVGIEDCVIAVLSGVLRRHPQFNGVLAAGGIQLSATQNIAVALSTPTGLVTPVISGAETLSLLDIPEKRRDLVSRGLAGKLKVSEMKGGTFTLSNLGLTRVRHFTPILNAPQVALLGLGRIEQRCMPDGASVAIRSVMGLSLTADHQWLDGDPCGQLLTDLCESLETFDITP